LQALAFQVGNEVSYNEIAQLVGVDKNTVNTYIDLLERNFCNF
jgi:predicted AAA+ superfamily ATPase